VFFLKHFSAWVNAILLDQQNCNTNLNQTRPSPLFGLVWTGLVQSLAPKLALSTSSLAFEPSARKLSSSSMHGFAAGPRFNFRNTLLFESSIHHNATIASSKAHLYLTEAP
jgi:hypothetical protein